MKNVYVSGVRAQENGSRVPMVIRLISAWVTGRVLKAAKWKIGE